MPAGPPLIVHTPIVAVDDDFDDELFDPDDLGDEGAVEYDEGAAPLSDSEDGAGSRDDVRPTSGAVVSKRTGTLTEDPMRSEDDGWRRCNM